MKKFELIKETIEFNGRTLYRIKALRDFGCVKKGDIGGWVEKEENLSHDGDCWIYDEAKAYDYARVYNEAKMFSNAEVYGYAVIHGNANIFGYAKVYGYAVIHGNANIFGYAKVYGYARVYDYAEVYNNARVLGNVCICGNAYVCGDAIISSIRDYIVFKNWWGSGRPFTWTRSNNMWKVGCFYGTGQELIDKAYKNSEENGREYERIVNYVQDIIGEPHFNKTNIND